MRRHELLRTLSNLEAFPCPDPRLEQVATPPGAAVEMLEAALARGDLEGRTVLDLGCGTGILGIGAGLLGAQHVTGVDLDAAALAVASANSVRLGVVEAEWILGEAASVHAPVDTVLMNPPFGAQRRHADRPFWETAFSLAGRSVYAFASRQSRTFIERRAVERNARVEESRAVDWRFPATFPHHRKRAVELPVDLWILRTGPVE